DARSVHVLIQAPGSRPISLRKSIRRLLAIRSPCRFHRADKAWRGRGTSFGTFCLRAAAFAPPRTPGNTPLVCVGDLFHCSATQRGNAFSLCRNRLRVPACLAQNPFCFAVIVSCSLERPFAFQFLAAQKHREPAFPVVAFDHFIRAQVPHHDRAGAVFVRRNHAFKLQIVDRMIFGFESRMRFVRFHRQTFWHGPRLEHVVHFETEIVMQVTCRVLLHYETTAASLCTAPGDCAVPVQSFARNDVSHRNRTMTPECGAAWPVPRTQTLSAASVLVFSKAQRDPLPVTAGAMLPSARNLEERHRILSVRLPIRSTDRASTRTGGHVARAAG